MVAGVYLHLHDKCLLVARGLYHGGELHGVVDGRRLSHLSHLRGVSLVCFQHRIVVAGCRRVLRVDEPQPSSALGEEELLPVFLQPCAPLFRVVVAQQCVAAEQAARLLHILAFLPHGDGAVEQALVVVGDAEALRVLVEQEVVAVEGGVEIRHVLSVVFLVCGDIGAELCVEAARLLLYELRVVRQRLRVFCHHEVLPVDVGELLARRLLLLQRVCHVLHLDVVSLHRSHKAIIHFLSDTVFHLRGTVAGGDVLVQLARYDMLSCKLADIHHGICEDGLRLVCHVCR